MAHRDRYGSPVPDITRWVKRAEEVLAKICGGATSLLAQGVWLGHRVSALREDVTLVYAYGAPQSISLHAASVRQFVFEYGKETRQEEVALLLENSDGHWFFHIPIGFGLKTDESTAHGSAADAGEH